VCIDDFGLHEGINQACVSLASAGRVSAISCMVDGPAWSQDLATVRGLPATVDVGLHLNLTEALPGARLHRPLSSLIRLAYARRLDVTLVRDEIVRQFDAFESGLGRPPDFVDGHQHVHQLPVVRDALIPVLDARKRPGKPWLRSTLPAPGWTTRGLPLGAIAKSRLIGALGAAALLAAADAHGYPHNRRMIGVYGFGGSEAGYLTCLRAWLACADDGDLLMCHPAATGPADDPILAARRREYAVLSGDAYPESLHAAGFAVQPLGRSSSQA
jgi:hypothetical protein